MVRGPASNDAATRRLDGRWIDADAPRFCDNPSGCARSDRARRVMSAGGSGARADGGQEPPPGHTRPGTRRVPGPLHTACGTPPRCSRPSRPRRGRAPGQPRGTAGTAGRREEQDHGLDGHQRDRLRLRLRRRPPRHAAALPPPRTPPQRRIEGRGQAGHGRRRDDDRPGTRHAGRVGQGLVRRPAPRRGPARRQRHRARPLPGLLRRGGPADPRAAPRLGGRPAPADLA